MNELIHAATAELAQFLAAKLPNISSEWWQRHVVDRLSFQQQRTVQERGFHTLQQLDFAALLRVLDQNWYELSGANGLPREGRNWVRELQTVRNKWAHLSVEAMPDSEVYRDVDTLGRLLTAIGVAPEVLSKVASVKAVALAAMARAQQSNVGTGPREPNLEQRSGAKKTSSAAVPPAEISMFNVSDGKRRSNSTTENMIPTATFEEAWAQITRQIRPGAVMQNWGAARGYTGGIFEVKDVERTSITVAGGGMKKSRRISKGEFQKVYAVWDTYIAGNFPRSKMTNLSQNTTYIVSILHRLGQRPS